LECSTHVETNLTDKVSAGDIFQMLDAVQDSMDVLIDYLVFKVLQVMFPYLPERSLTRQVAVCDDDEDGF
jgi:hypothetical protein